MKPELVRDLEDKQRDQSLGPHTSVPPLDVLQCPFCERTLPLRQRVCECGAVLPDFGAIGSARVIRPERQRRGRLPWWLLFAVMLFPCVLSWAVGGNGAELVALGAGIALAIGWLWVRNAGPARRSPVRRAARAQEAEPAPGAAEP